MNDGNGAMRRMAALSAVLFFSTMFACAMILIRYYVAGDARFHNLLWNLFLAWIPYIIAIIIYSVFDDMKEKRLSSYLAFLLFLWLLFYPNAPYIFTDLIHLIDNPRVPARNRLVTNTEVLLWYDLIINISFAWLGHILGLISLYIVHRVIERLSSPVTAWVVIVVFIGLSGFGVFLGRFIRLNSWHLFIRPLETLRFIVPYLVSFNSFAFSSAFASFIFLSYIPAFFIAGMRKE